MKLVTFYDHILELSEQEHIPLSEALLEAKRLGIDLLEVSSNNIAGHINDVKESLIAAGMGVSSVCAYFDFGQNPEIASAGIPALEAAAALGAPRVLVIPGFFAAHDTDAEKEKQTQNMIHALNRFAEKAKALGISLIMEEYDSLNAPYRNTAGLQRFLNFVPDLSCAFDTGNFIFSGEDVLTAYDALKNRITHVHLKDRAFHVPSEGGIDKEAADGRILYPAAVGQGALPLSQIITRLKADGYCGDYTIEHYGAANQLQYLASSVTWLKQQLT